MADERRFIKNIPGGRGDLPFSRAVVARGMVWVSGVGGADQVTGEIGETIEEQTRGCIENIRKILAEAGSSLDRVVWMQVGLANPAEYARMNTEYLKHFSADALPARATVKQGVDSPRGKLVIACTALVDESR